MNYRVNLYLDERTLLVADALARLQKTSRSEIVRRWGERYGQDELKNLTEREEVKTDEE